MALRVWLPLNGNLNNYGLDNITIDGTASFVESNMGKGQDLLKQLTFTVPSLVDKKVFSVAWWFKIKSNESRTGDWMDHICFSLVNSEGATNSHRCECCYTTANIVANWYGGLAAWGSSGAQKDKWYHMTYTCDGTTAKSYLNGVCYQTAAVTGTDYRLTGYVRVGETNKTEGIMCDLRLYDHALSPREVKEISKGLIAHYALNDQYDSSLKNIYGEFYAQGNCSSSNWTKKKLEGERGYNYTLTYTGTGSNHYPNFHCPTFAFTVGKRYYYSLKVRCNKWTGGSLRLRAARVSNDWVTNSVEICSSEKADGLWHEYYATVVIPESFDRSGTIVTSNPCFELYTTSLSTADFVYEMDFDVKDIQVVESDEYVPFISNETTRNYVSDLSGNKYHLVKNGVTKWHKDSAIRDGSLVFDGLANQYLARDILTFLKPPFTFNIWAYQTAETVQHGTGTISRQYILSQGRDCGLAGFSLYSEANIARLMIGTSTDGTYYAISSGVNIYNNGWHMLTGTYDGTTAKLYVDGVLKGSKETTAEISWGQAGGLTIGKMGHGHTSATQYFPFAGYLNDARIYASALSDKDILTLYKNRGIIDNKGNVYSNSLVETGDVLVFEPQAINHTNFGDTFTKTIVNDAEAPTKKVMKLECTAVGADTKHGFYLSGNGWTAAQQKMKHGKTYVLSMYVKMNKEHDYKMSIECASSQDKNSFKVNTKYKKLVNVFTYNANATHKAITNYIPFAVGDICYIHSFKVEEYVNGTEINKKGELLTLIDETITNNENVKSYKHSMVANEYIEI